MPSNQATRARFVPHRGFLPESRNDQLRLRAATETERYWRERLQFLEALPLGGLPREPGTGIFVGEDGEIDANAFLHLVLSRRCLPRQMLFIATCVDLVPRVPLAEQCESVALGNGIHVIVIRYGFNDDPDIPRTLRAIAAVEADASTTRYYVGSTAAARRRLLATMPVWRKWLIALMSGMSVSAVEYFRLPPDRTTEVASDSRLPFTE